MLFDIWKEKQRQKFVSIQGFLKWFLISQIFAYFAVLTGTIAVVFVSDVGDVTAILNAAPLFIPIYGITCIKSEKDNWKHRFFICFTFIFIGIIFIAQPGFLFGYDNSTNVHPFNQTIGCSLALFSSVMAALLMISSTMLKKLAFADIIRNELSPAVDGDIIGGDQHNLGDEEQQQKRQLRSGAAEGVESQTVIIGETMINENEKTPLLSKKDPDGKDTVTYYGEEFKDHETSGGEESLTSGNMSDDDNNNGGEDNRCDMSKITKMIENTTIKPQSREFIVENDRSLTVLSVEYGSIILIVLCLIFSFISWLIEYFSANNSFEEIDENFNILSRNDYYNVLNVWWYVVLGAVLSVFIRFFQMYAALKLPNAPLIGIIGLSDIIFGYVVSYAWLGEEPDTFGIIGACLIVVAIIVSLYPWHKHSQISKSF